MAVSFRFWEDCVDTKDLETMWSDPDVVVEWLNAGETRGSKIRLSRDPDGQVYLTQTEMKAVAGIVVRRHFHSQIDSDMLCALATLESDRQPLATRYNKKTKETTAGIMQISSKTADWLVRDHGYRNYDITKDSEYLFKPFVNVYLGAAYLKWLSTFDNKERSEEFMVRAFKRGTKKATSKSTLPYWKQYLSVKESLPARQVFESGPVGTAPQESEPSALENKGPVNTTWDSRTSKEEMEEMWNNLIVRKEWTKSGWKRGNVGFALNKEGRPYISAKELKAVAEIILKKHFSSKRVQPTVPCALAEIVSTRLVDGKGQRTGLMGIDYATARWLYKDLGYKGYRIDSSEDLGNPFVSMYFGAAYLAWLSEYEGRERTPQFIVQAYLAGPKNVTEEIGPQWLKFEDALSLYEPKKDDGSCSIL